jgi:hypothetical protein
VTVPKAESYPPYIHNPNTPESLLVHRDLLRTNSQAPKHNPAGNAKEELA